MLTDANHLTIRYYTHPLMIFIARKIKLYPIIIAKHCEMKLFRRGCLVVDRKSNIPAKTNIELINKKGLVKWTKQKSLFKN